MLGASPDPVAGFGEGNREGGMEMAIEGKGRKEKGVNGEKGKGEWKLGGVCVIGFRG